MSTYFSLFRRHGLKLSWDYFVGRFAINIVAMALFILLVGVIFVLGLGMGAVAISADNPYQAFLAQGVWTIVFLLITTPVFIFYLFGTEAFASGGLYGSIKEIFTGEKARLRTFFSFGWRYLWSLTGQLIILLLLLALSLFIPFGLVVLLFATENILGVLFAFLIGFLAIVWICYYFILLVHAPVILVYEEVGIFRSISLTFRVVRKAFGEAFLSVLSLFLVIFIGHFLLFIPMLFLALLRELMEQAGDTVFLLGFPFFLLLLLVIIGMSMLFAVATHLLLMYRYVYHLRPKAMG